MYLPELSFHACASYVAGYDAATEGGLLVGFHQWLVVKVGHSDNLAWYALVREVMGASANSPTDHAGEVAFLLATLDEFLSERARRGGLRRIFSAYEAWLRQQAWYTPESPQWIPELK